MSHAESKSVDDMDREELRELVKELEAEIERLNNNVIGLYEGQLPSVKDRLDDLEEQLSDVEMLAQNAIGIAQTEAKTSEAGSTKKGKAVRQIRQRLVKGAASGQTMKDAVSTSSVKEMGRPDIEYSSRTIHDAMQSLEDNWDAFTYDAGTPGPNGDESRLKCDGELLDPSLVRGVEEALNCSGLNETLIMSESDEGGS
jgi:hypothetical protein